MSYNEQEIYALERPIPKLLTYYLLVSFFSMCLMPLVFLPMFFKYRTLRYRFDEKGISMSWGILFRQEVYLTYRKIQDIHLTRNIVERWLGLGTLQVQTASGSAGAEMAIVGILDLEGLRNFIYAQMKGHDPQTKDDATPVSGAVMDEKMVVLRQIHDQLSSLNDKLEARDV